MDNKAFPLIICIVAIGIILYTLPQFAAFFGFQAFASNKLSPIVFISKDNGATFDETYWSGTAAPTVYDFDVDSNNSSFVYAATSQGFYISRDNGAHWYNYSDLEGQLSKAAVYQVKTAANKPGRFFVSLFKNGQGGIYQTDDRFFTLKKIFDTKDAVAYKIDSVGGNLYLGLSDGRLISYSLSDSGFKLLASVGSPITDIVVTGSQVHVATKAKTAWVGSVYGGDFVTLQEKQPSQSAYTASLLGADLSTVVSKTPIQTILPDGQGGVYLSSDDKLYKSVNSGQDWQVVLDVPGRMVNSLNIGDNGRIIVGTGSKQGN